VIKEREAQIDGIVDNAVSSLLSGTFGVKTAIASSFKCESQQEERPKSRCF
jgi:hypothetical protein